MVVADESIDDCSLDGGQITKGEGGLVELSVIELLADHRVNHLGDALDGRILLLGVSTCRTFDGVSDHEDRHFLALRCLPVVAE